MELKCCTLLSVPSDGSESLNAGHLLDPLKCQLHFQLSEGLGRISIAGGFLFSFTQRGNCL